MPAEVGQVEFQLQAGVEQILPIGNLIWLVINVYRCHSLLPRTAMFRNMSFEILSEKFQPALQRLHRPRRQRAEGVSWSQQTSMLLQLLQMSSLTVPRLHCGQNFSNPLQAGPTGRAPAARFLREEGLEVAHKANWAGFVIQDNHRASTQAASHLL